MLESASIPGMVEPVEQQLLFDLAASDDLAGKGAIVEFGCFFGLSTSCLINGAARHWSTELGRGPRVFAYDSFGCADGDGFAQHVWGISRRRGVDGLVRREGGRLDFYPVYRHYVGAAEDAGILKTIQVELRDATYDGGPIALMHIDAPKFYEEFKFVLVRFFPHLAPGGVVVFQDYFYHWSASLIAAAQLLEEAGILRAESSKASSLVARVLRTPTAVELLELDLAMASASVGDLLDRGLETVRGLPLDRPEQFVPRVHLAKVQHLWEAGDFRAAQQALMRMIRDQGGKFGTAPFADFQELMAYGFSLRKLYERNR